MLAETDLAWAAGILDGEGFLTLTKSPTRRGFLFRIGVNSTDAEMAPTLHRMFGGGLYHRAKKVADHHKLQLGWAIQGTAEAVRVLQLLLPYLRTKRRQAYEFLAAAERRRQGPFRIQTDPALWARLELHETSIKALKRESLEVL